MAEAKNDLTQAKLASPALAMWINGANMDAVSQPLYMMKTIHCYLVLFSQLALNASAAPAATNPNIIVILVDDMGFADVGCYGSEIPTPNLDKLAADGLRSTHFHNDSRCSPSRATVLTGLYSQEAGIGVLTGQRKGAGRPTAAGLSGPSQ